MQMELGKSLLEPYIDPDKDEENARVVRLSKKAARRDKLKSFGLSIS